MGVLFCQTFLNNLSFKSEDTSERVKATKNWKWCFLSDNNLAFLDSDLKAKCWVCHEPTKMTVNDVPLEIFLPKSQASIDRHH